ncbi:MAG: aminoglycoside phosphotransferase family protein, partial [Ruminococcus sp.]|nr:aminoglycoside phosphotransferase family protein [Ruminococcus sp.]
ILQSLNRKVFKNPEIVMNNILLIQEAFKSEKSISIPHYLKCNDRNYAELDGEIWRVCEYIESKDNYSDKNYTHGFTVGRFLRVINSVEFEFDNPISELHRFGGNLPKRNIHGDTKADNIILGEKPAIIDFDMAMTNSINIDYGDMIRSVTTDFFSLDKIRKTTEGFAEGIDGLLTNDEINSLYSGIVLIISELAERYRAGNKSFPNKTNEQCHEREKELISQLDEFYKHEDKIIKIIKKCFE